jgi:uncharacterized membrane protein (UPF0127 family)
VRGFRSSPDFSWIHGRLDRSAGLPHGVVEIRMNSGPGVAGVSGIAVAGDGHTPVQNETAVIPLSGLAGWVGVAQYAGVTWVCCSQHGEAGSAVRPIGRVRFGVWALLSVLLVTGMGCDRGGSDAVVTAGPRNLPTKAQPKLPTLKLWLGPHELTAEVARNERERTAGMMFRTHIAENEAMLFVFPYKAQVSFWMKNVPIPLSCAYLNDEGVIVELHELKPEDETSVPSSSREIQFVVETAQGWFERNGVGVGTLVQTEKGTLRETFFGRPAGAGR